MEYVEFKGKTKNDAITEACRHFSVPSDKLDYEVIDEGKAGFLGMGSRPALIKARVREEKPEVVETVEPIAVPATAVLPVNEDTTVKEADKKEAHEAIDVEAVTKKFLADVFAAMGIAVEITVKYDEELKTLEADLSGDEMGVLIGKRGQTLDSLQYLISLVVNKGTTEYIRVKVDTENYRQRRKETLENLAKNISYKVKRTRRPVSLEPMNPYERRIIHSALQNDKYVTTHSEGEEPFRRVVVTPKKDSNYNDAKGYRGNRNYNSGYHKGYSGNYNRKNKENRERTENHTEAVE